MFDWFRNGGSWKGDLVAACAFLLVAVATFFVATELGWYPFDGASYRFVAVLTAVVWPLSRAFPRITLLLAAIAVAAPFWQFAVVEVRMLPLMVAAFRAAGTGAPRAYVIPVTLIGGLAGVLNVPFRIAIDAVLLVGRPMFLPPPDPSRAILVGSALGAMVALGYALQAQRAIAADLSERNAELVALREADRVRVETEMRTALARDIHDIVAHHVSGIVVRAQAAARISPNDAPALREAMNSIAADGSEALAGMRQAVRMLQTVPGGTSTPGGGIPAAFDVAEHLRSVVERARASGRQVDVSGELVGGAEFVHVALLRIVQESLTNVMLHSDATRVEVTLASTAATLSATVSDNGRPRAQVAAAAGGNGIRGMQERARALGGTMEAGPLPEGGWRVHATLPGSGRRTERTA